MDFYRIDVLEKPNGALHIRPNWLVKRSQDLMTRGGGFYAIWDEANNTWSTDIFDVQRLVDADLYRHKEMLEAKTGLVYFVDTMESHKTKLWDDFARYLRNSGNNSHPLDETLVFANTTVKKEDYSSKRLPYELHDGNIEAWDEIVSTLYNEEERAKIEWAIGAIVSGDSKKIQKFLVFYGPPGTGKSTVLNIVEKLFVGYTAVFDARELAGNNNSFATSAFKSNPLVAIQHDGDLSRIYDNTKLNSIVAHEILPVNEKYAKVVEMRANAFLLMGTNLPVKISDAKAGILRRLIDVSPTGQKLDHDTYFRLMDLVTFELGAIAKHCYDRYREMGKNYYGAYRPTEMQLQTDVFYNYVEAHMDIFEAEDGVTLKKAWELYKTFCSDTGVDKTLAQYKMREELKNYFDEFEERATINGHKVRSYYRGFKPLGPLLPTSEVPVKPIGDYQIVLEDGPSVFDEENPTLPAQYATEDGYPKSKWANTTTMLSDLDPTKLHYVKLPEHHIVIDFDLKDVTGEKSLELNLEAAAKWPATYTELSKSGKGVHLHYYYYGDVAELAQNFAIGIEVQTLLGDKSLRRKLSKANRVAIATLEEGTLPRKEKKLISDKTFKDERFLRSQIEKNLRKEYHSSTKSSVDFICHLLNEAYDSGMPFDVTDMQPRVLTFAFTSHNQADVCVKNVQAAKFASKSEVPTLADEQKTMVFYDVEVYPNLLVICWKIAGNETVIRMINPTPQEVEPLLAMPLVGFNNRRYDNHILYARYLGWDLEEIYNLSQRIITGGNQNQNMMFGPAYGLSYADIYDFSSKKQGLKKFMIELGIHHQELDLPWDEPVSEDKIERIVEYCVNDVRATEAVFNSRAQDWTARLILAKLSGLTPNHTTQTHTAKIIFGDNKAPQNSFVYTNLSEQFPGYEFDGKDSTYRGEKTGEGGYVYAEPGIFENVTVLDVTSMHPTSIKELNVFGPYTEKYNELTAARVAIKCEDYETASRMLDGKLAEFLDGNESHAQDLAYALKIVINIVYGLTSAKFPNAFRDPRNADNIVAKRGALFMLDVKHALQEKGWQVIHIKTDSVKISNATPEIIKFLMEMAREYGYEFGIDAVYSKFALVNDAVYVAFDDQWHATGAQFQHRYVFKKLFTKEPVTFDDLCETKNVAKGNMYLKFNETVHVGRTGSFVPVMENGAELIVVRDGKPGAVAGTKGYKWITRDMAKALDSQGRLKVDWLYFEELAEKAKAQIERFGNLEEFVNG